MPTLAELIRGSPDIKEKPIPEAHWLEKHFVHPKLSWEEASRLVVQSFPRETRKERPAGWYLHLYGTHWPGCVPPGNGPFYIPEWVVEEAWNKHAIQRNSPPRPEEQAIAQEAMEAQLKRAGFKVAIAHVVMLPQDGEYLHAAMRVARDRAWNVDPFLYRAYVYPSLSRFAKSGLRPFNTSRWTSYR